MNRTVPTWPNGHDDGLSPADRLAESEVAVTDRTPDPIPRREVPPDPWGQAVADFLADLLDNVDVLLHTDVEPDDGQFGDRIPSVPARGSDGRLRQFSLRVSSNASAAYAADGRFPSELADLPDGALRALGRVTRSTSAADVVYPSVAKALHEVIIAEVLADRLARRTGPAAVVNDIAGLVAETLDYFIELAGTRHEGGPVSHGVVIAADTRGLVPIDPAVAYPGQLPTRKRTPLLFDGTQSVLVITSSGQALRGVSRESLPSDPTAGRRIEVFDEFPGVDGALTAAASASFRGVGVYLRPDQSIWVFDDGEPLFIRRTSHWKSIAVQSFIGSLAVLGETTTIGVAERLGRAALLMSMRGQGAVFAIASGPASLAELVQPKDRYPTRRFLARGATVDDELHRLLTRAELASSGALARLARLDGATIIDTSGELLAYGAIVRSADSRGEGARTAAARALSMHVNLALSVSQDGPITVFHRGETALEVL